ncbi:MAG: hypothetical protein U5L11_07255 [Arhodomonas sp.]|nr:hypothetical protein [Arhodomonas sp.]
MVAAVGLTLADLFPDRPEGRRPLRKGERWGPRDALTAVAGEALVAAIACEDVVAGRHVTAD